MHPDSKGFYLETILTNEVETIIRIDKKELKKKICSHDINEDMYFVGEEHKDGKIKGMGKMIKIENDIKEIYIGQINENKIYSYQLDLNKNSDKVILKIPNTLEFIESYLHGHKLKYRSATGNWICDFCSTYFNKNEESFGCRDCDFDLCLKCLSSQFKKSPWHSHPIEYKEIVYLTKSFICDICERVFYNIKSFHCDQCEFDACLNCATNTRKYRNTIDSLNNSIYEIYTQNGISQGFFCKFYYNNNSVICCLLVDNNFLSVKKIKEIFLNKSYIAIKINQFSSINLTLNSKRKIWEEINEYTCIEILNEDNLLWQIKFYEIDDNYYNNFYYFQNYNTKPIIVPYFDNNQLKYEIGRINYIQYDNKYFLIRNIYKNGIFMPIVSLGNLKMLGIYLRNYNKGLYFKYILNKIHEKNEIMGNNEIICKLNFSLVFLALNLNKDIILFRQNYFNKNEIWGGFDVYLNGNNINNMIINQGDDWKINRINFPNFLGCVTIKISFKNNLSNLNKFFENCLYEEIDLSNFNTGFVNDISYMFRGCQNLKNVNIKNIDTSKLLNMKSLFHYCINLKNIEGLNTINTSNVNNMSTMFHLCIALKSIDLSSFDTSKVTSMEGMFSSCISLENITGINRFNVNSVYNMIGMFNDCPSLRNLYLPNIACSKADKRYMFNNCNNYLNFGLFNISSNEPIVRLYGADDDIYLHNIPFKFCSNPRISIIPSYLIVHNPFLRLNIIFRYFSYSYLNN